MLRAALAGAIRNDRRVADDRVAGLEVERREVPAFGHGQALERLRALEADEATGRALVHGARLPKPVERGIRVLLERAALRL